jgi:Uma2 family endonuclease
MGQPIRVRVQNPIRIPHNDSEPEPDVVWTIDKDYSRLHPQPPGDVLLVIEVAESSLEFDRDEKVPVYAEAGISDYWIVNLIAEQVDVYRNPNGRDYQEKSTYRGDAAIHPLALPAATLQPSRLFGGS